MPDSRTILPAPKLLNLISVRAGANLITLAARASSRVASCPVCEKQSVRVHSRYTRTLADLPWQGIPVTLHLHVRRFFCDERTCHRAIFAERLRGAFVWCRQALRSQNRAARRMVHARLLRPRRGSGLSSPARPRDRGLWRHPAQPHPFNTASRSRDAKSIECGRLRFPSRNPLRNGTGGSRTS